MMYKTCSRCGKMHPYNYKCKVGKAKYDYYASRTDNEMTRYTWAWQKKSKKIRDESNWLCEVCKDEGMYTYDGIEVHHITKLRDSPDGLLDNLNLICLCKLHHKLAEENRIDKEYLLKLARQRENKDTPRQE